MITIILGTISAFIEQFSSSIIKKVEQVTAANHLSLWSVAWASILSGTPLLFIVMIVRNAFTIEQATIPYLFIRIILEWLQVLVTFKALKEVPLSIFNFVRSLTIVVVLFLDIAFLNSSLSVFVYLAIIVITGSLSLIGKFRLVKGRQWLWALVSAVNAAILITITKYTVDINDPEMNEVVTRVGILVFLGIMVVLNDGVKYLYKSFNKQTILLIPSRAFVGFINIAALSAGNATIYSTIDRSGSMLFGILFGKFSFGEKKVKQKLFVAGGIAIGIVLLSIGSLS